MASYGDSFNLTEDYLDGGRQDDPFGDLDVQSDSPSPPTFLGSPSRFQKIRKSVTPFMAAMAFLVFVVIVVVLVFSIPTSREWAMKLLKIKTETNPAPNGGKTDHYTGKIQNYLQEASLFGSLGTAQQSAYLGMDRATKVNTYRANFA